MSELKECPFCGKVDELYSIPRFLEITKGETKEIEWAVGCKRCDVHLYRARYAKDEGIATWNTRPIEDELRAEIARRDEQIAELTATTHSQTLRNAELSRFVWWVFHVYARNVQELTSGITEACAYETEEKAEKGKYGLPIRCWKYVRHLEEYTAGIYNGTYLDSETSTGVKDPPAGHWEGCEEVHWDCRIAQLEKEIARLNEIIARLKEDGERLAETHIYAARYGDTNCIHCARVEDNGNIDHETDCPITLHRALMKELE